MYDGGIISLGVVFKVTPSGVESVLHTFTGGSDGAHPKGSLIADGKGNLYGTTSSGEGLGGGTVFRITTAGVLTVLHTFSGSDGYDPNAGLAMDAEGDLFGTTFSGGSSNDGVVFEISAEDTETVLHDFSGSDGATPYSGLIIGQRGGTLRHNRLWRRFRPGHGIRGHTVADRNGTLGSRLALRRAGRYPARLAVVKNGSTP